MATRSPKKHTMKRATLLNDELVKGLRRLAKLTPKQRKARLTALGAPLLGLPHVQHGSGMPTSSVGRKALTGVCR